MTITPEQVDLWRLSPSEHQRLEFKEARTQYDNDKLNRYCVALANEGGGFMLLGIADKPPRPVVGTGAFRDPVAMSQKFFELYLMSQMSASHLVQRALQRRGLTDAQMKVTAKAVIDQCQLRDGTPHSTYHQVLQSVVLLEASTLDIKPSSSFAGSISYFYRLPEWPDTPLQIIRGPRGNAWGIMFVQDPTTLSLALTQRQIQPWRFALDGVRALFAWKEDDTWSDYQRDLYQQAPTAGRMRGTFDFGLLQDWREDVTKPLPKWQSPAPPTLTRLGWPRRP